MGAQSQPVIPWWVYSVLMVALGIAAVVFGDYAHDQTLASFGFAVGGAGLGYTVGKPQQPPP